jgi:hypothetical protein
MDLAVASKIIPRVSNIYASKYSMHKQDMPQNIPCVSKIFASDWSEIICIISYFKARRIVDVPCLCVCQLGMMETRAPNRLNQ